MPLGPHRKAKSILRSEELLRDDTHGPLKKMQRKPRIVRDLMVNPLQIGLFENIPLLIDMHIVDIHDWERLESSLSYLLSTRRDTREYFLGLLLLSPVGISRSCVSLGRDG